MDINKIFLSSTIAQSIDAIVNSNTATLQTKANNLNNLLNEYSQKLSNVQSEYQNGLSEADSGDPLFNRVGWESEAPKLLDEINNYNSAIDEIYNQLKQLGYTETNKESKDRYLTDIINSAPLAMAGYEQIKKFYEKHRSNIRSKSLNSDSRDSNSSSDSTDQEMDSRSGDGRLNGIDDDDGPKPKLPSGGGSLDEVSKLEHYAQDIAKYEKQVDGLIDSYNENMQRFGREGQKAWGDTQKAYEAGEHQFAERFANVKKLIIQEEDTINHDRQYIRYEAKQYGIDDIIDSAAPEVEQITSDPDIDYDPIDTAPDVVEGESVADDVLDILGDISRDVPDFIE